MGNIRISKQEDTCIQYNNYWTEQLSPGNAANWNQK